ncbi:MAG: aminotransferase class I/II-fold pyridoxal phosphate-dependent enzyme, partial [Betaproteobacteria bacterium]|nr:aminotransferase class I/II-fold pyridoxal phosphate-dependent enzyme [Betaproteobacteria bacterium]
TYHGCAMSGVVQAASVAAWNDEAHVIENRNLYRTKFAQVTPVLAEVMDVQLPDASFYLWAGVPAAWNNSDTDFSANWDAVPDTIWAQTQLVFVCSPGNPTGKVMPLAEWKKLFELSEKYGFVIASDECYSEIYFRDEPPLGGLEAASQLGYTEWLAGGVTPENN